jgi:hypothetical protein
MPIYDHVIAELLSPIHHLSNTPLPVRRVGVVPLLIDVPTNNTVSRVQKPNVMKLSNMMYYLIIKLKYIHRVIVDFSFEIIIIYQTFNAFKNQ